MRLTYILLPLLPLFPLLASAQDINSLIAQANSLAESALENGETFVEITTTLNDPTTAASTSFVGDASDTFESASNVPSIIEIGTTDIPGSASVSASVSVPPQQTYQLSTTSQQSSQTPQPSTTSQQQSQTPQSSTTSQQSQPSQQPSTSQQQSQSPSSSTTPPPSPTSSPASSPAPAPTPSPSPPPSPTPSQSPNNSTSTLNAASKVGLGVGLGLGIPLLALCAFLLWRFMGARKRSSLAGVQPTASGSEQVVQSHWSGRTSRPRGGSLPQVR